MRIRSLAWVLPSCLAVLPLAAGAQSVGSKIDPALAAALASAPDGRVDMLVVLAEQADLRGIDGSRLEKGRRVYERLTETAARTQAPLLDWLRTRGVEARSFWITNLIHLRGDAPLADALASRPDVARVDLNAYLAPPEPAKPAPEELFGGPDLFGSIEWNILRVNADDVWALGFTGQGVVVGGQDTGYDWDHPALRDQYRGWTGSSADHDYDWHDAVHTDVDGGGNTCGFSLPAPCADGSHGTHTMGTMVGDDGGGNQIGMAPGARWIGCRNMENGWGTVVQYTECFEWFVAPTTVAGTNPNPALAPHVINNSWGCPFSYPGLPPGAECEGHPVTVLRTVVENTRAAGIMVVVSAGNEGPGCSSVEHPPAYHDASFSVGSTTNSDAISSFSSRGPVTADGSNRRKPDISAPGSGIRSCVPGTGYGSSSGTSMAGPHVAGLVALLVSANPAKLEGNVDGLEELIREGAVHPSTSSQNCGGTPATQFPNNTFGWGRIDALASVQLLQSGLVFRDDFDAGDLTDWSSRVP